MLAHQTQIVRHRVQTAIDSHGGMSRTEYTVGLANDGVEDGEMVCRIVVEDVMTVSHRS